MMQAARRHSGAAFAAASIVLLLALAPGPASAQAWLPEQGNLTFTLDYSNVLNKKHYDSTGAEIDIGHTSLRITTLAVIYSPSDRVTIDASLPLVFSRYIGEGGGGHDHEIDNGEWHGTFTDLQASVHYQVTDGPIAFAPYLGAVVPTHDYTTFGHAAPGRGVNEYWLGFYSAMSLNEWLPRSYAQLRGNYAFVEKVAGVSHDRTNAILEVGHFLNESWGIWALLSRQWTHGGIDLPVPPTDPLFPYHDQIADDEFLNAGAGVSWSVSGRLSIYGLYMESLEGRNSHKVDHRVSMGLTWGFGRD